MSVPYTASEALARVESEMERMLAGDVKPYACGRKICEVAFTHASAYPEPMWPLWLIWGALTDWVEVEPEEEELAEREMLRASREWLDLARDDKKASDAYLDRWVHDELGIERKARG